MEEVGQKEGISQSLLQHAKCRHPRNMGHDGDDDHGEWEVWALESDFSRRLVDFCMFCWLFTHSLQWTLASPVGFNQLNCSWNHH